MIARLPVNRAAHRVANHACLKGRRFDPPSNLARWIKRRFCLAIRDKFDSLEQPATTNIANIRMLSELGLQRRHQLLPLGFYPSDQTTVQHRCDHSNASRSRCRVAQVGVSVLEVDAHASLNELQDLFNDYDFLGFPVTDGETGLVGVISRTAVDAAILARAEGDTLRMQGIVGDELRTMPLAIRSRRRLAWLSANIVLNIIAASVISAYEDTLAAVIAIAVFLPMVSDMSGCSGNQAVGVTMRELSLGLVRPKDAMRVWMKEVSVGVINGIVLGILIGIVCWIWKGNPYLGLVIGLALALNTIIAVSIGGVVPLLLKRVGQDPAVASGPLLTTITDMAGFFLVLSLATLMMPLLID